MPNGSSFTPYIVQHALGVPQDGKWGPVTEAAARVFLGDKAAGWDRKRLVVAVQQQMMLQLGITVEVDGFNGPRTKAAFEALESLLRSEPHAPHPEIGWYSDLFKAGEAAVQPPPVPGPTQPAPVSPVLDLSKITRNKWPRQSGVPAFYGSVGSHQQLIKPPWPMVLDWDRSTSVRTISLHAKVVPSAQECFAAALAYYGQAGIEKLGLNHWGGSLNVRRMTGGSAWSMHAWGIALDFDPGRNEFRQNHSTARLAKKDAEAWWQIWEAAGWLSLGRSRDFDWMHVQAALL